MKTLTPKMAVISMLLMMSILLSCSSSRTALNCPEILQNKNSPRVSSKLKKTDNRLFAYSQNKNTKNRNVRSLSASRKRNNSALPSTITKSDLEINSSAISSLEEITPTHIGENTIALKSSNDYSDVLEQSLPPTEPTHLGTSSTSEMPEVNEEGIKETKLPTTNNSGAISQTNLSSSINPNINATISQDTEPQIEGLGLAGFVSGVVGLLVAALPLGLVATVFGAVSLSKIKRNPAKFKGRGFAIASLTLGIIDLVFGIIIIALIL